MSSAKMPTTVVKAAGSSETTRAPAPCDPRKIIYRQPPLAYLTIGSSLGIGKTQQKSPLLQRRSPEPFAPRLPTKRAGRVE